LVDFEMTRLKEIQEASLLRLYLRLEQYFPEELMFVASRAIQAIVAQGELTQN
jgi:hypothetical protein